MRMHDLTTSQRPPQETPCAGLQPTNKLLIVLLLYHRTLERVDYEFVGATVRE